MEKNDFVLERLLASLFGVCVTLAILPVFQELNEIIPLQEIGFVAGIIILVGMCVVSGKKNK